MDITSKNGPVNIPSGTKRVPTDSIIELQSQTVAGQEIQTVNARELHFFLESKQDFSTWIKARIKQYSFVEDTDFIKFHKSVEQVSGTKKRIEYHLTLDMAKELSMVERNERGKQARQYFIECERRARQQPAVQPMSELDLIISTAKEMKRINEQVAAQETRLTAIEQARAAAEAELNEFPYPDEIPLEMPIRKRIVQLVRSYASDTGINYGKAFNKLYSEYLYRHNTNLPLKARNETRRAKGKKKYNPLDIAEREGRLKSLYGVAYELFIAKSLALCSIPNPAHRLPPGALPGQLPQSQPGINGKEVPA